MPGADHGAEQPRTALAKDVVDGGYQPVLVPADRLTCSRLIGLQKDAAPNGDATQIET